MRKLTFFCVLLGLSATIAQAGAVQSEQGSPLPGIADNFRLFDNQGSSYELHRQFLKPAVVLVSLSPECETIKDQAPYLQNLKQEFSDKNVLFLLVDSTKGVTQAAAKSYADALGIQLPILLDDSQMVARTLGLTHSAEALLIDTDDWNIAYRGAIRSESAEPLKEAIHSLLSDSDIAAPYVKSEGALLKLGELEENLTYVHDIAPILEERCATCHRKGDIAPFEMSGYAKVKNYVPMIREVTMAKRMPPWHAEPHIADYANDQSLQPDELVKLISWIDSGAPRGEGDDPLLKYSEEKESEWALGEPDYIVSMSTPKNIPAQGVFDYHHDNVTVNLNGDKWLRALEVLPDNRAVVHHSLIFLEFPERLKHLEPEWGGGTGGYFAGYGPGYQTFEFPEGTAKFIPDGATVEFQMHYTATGKPETDQTRLGLYFYDGEPEREFITYGASNFAIEIPPQAEDQEFQSLYYVRHPVQICSMAPHMHFRGSRFKYVAEYPDGKTETLLNVPFYDFNWQRDYRLPEPKNLPAGTTIRCIAGYNNSPTNPNNPDPEDTVTWGSQSWEEMLIGHLSFAKLEKTDVNTPPPAELGQNMGEAITEENVVGTEWRWGEYRVYFFKPGKALVNDSLVTDWTMDGKVLYLTLRDTRKFPIFVQGDQLNLFGGKLEYIGRF